MPERLDELGPPAGAIVRAYDTARLVGSSWLRSALMNPLAGAAGLAGVLDAIREAAR